MGGHIFGDEDRIQELHEHFSKLNQALTAVGLDRYFDAQNIRQIEIPGGQGQGTDLERAAAKVKTINELKEEYKYGASDVLFVDDSSVNIDAAREQEVCAVMLVPQARGMTS